MTDDLVAGMRAELAAHRSAPPPEPPDGLRTTNRTNQTNSTNGATSSASSTSSDSFFVPALADAALYGLAGDVVNTIRPHTESHPAAVLASFLALFGCYVGPGPHMLADSAQHPARLFVVVVGRTAKARKGSSWMNLERVWQRVDDQWLADNVIDGLASGEALVAHFESDAADRRALINAGEFTRILSIAGRAGSVLSQNMREAWDGRPLQNRRARERIVIPGAHVAIVGHVTRADFLTNLEPEDITNGFANRMLFVGAERSRRLADGGNLTDDDCWQLATKIRRAAMKARSIGRMRRTPAAADRWRVLYDRMGDDDPDGPLGDVIARAEAQTLRLSVAYALLDGSAEIDVDHVNAAYALWRYCRATAAQLFGDKTGDRDADRLLARLRDAADAGLDRTAQSAVFHRNRTRDQLDRIRELLAGRRLAVEVTEETDGPPRHRMFAVEYAPEEVIAAS